MDTKTLKSFVTEHPNGVRIRLIDGTLIDIPHRDYIWFTPAYGETEQRAGRYATSFWVHDAAAEETRLINALLVAEVTPLPTNGQAQTPNH